MRSTGLEPAWSPTRSLVLRVCQFHHDRIIIIKLVPKVGLLSHTVSPTAGFHSPARLPLAEERSDERHEPSGEYSTRWKADRLCLLWCRRWDFGLIRYRLPPDFEFTLRVNGAEGGTRTHTVSLPPDFESGASAIPPLRLTGGDAHRP